MVARFTAAMSIAAALGLATQTPPQQPFRTSTDLVPVFATVLKPDGTFAGGLTKDDFIVLDNGRPQDIVSFSDKAQAISVSVILDTSGSMTDARARMFGAAGVFLNELLPDDRAMVGSLVFQGPSFTADKSRLQTSLALMPADPGSPIFAALDRSMTMLAPETNRRVIVIYTDGKNEDIRQTGMRGSASSQAPPKIAEPRILQRVEAEHVMVYAIGFEGVSLSGSMKNVAKRSGGRATELKAKDDLGAALAAVADELHHQYLLGFTPPAKDGQTHTIEVRVKTPGLTVRARQSYTAR